MSKPRGYNTWVHSQTQNKAQWLAACGHVSASSQSLRLILCPQAANHCTLFCVRKQPIIAVYFEFENELNFYSLEARWSRDKKSYKGCSNMNASSFITFFTYMLRKNFIPFWKELFIAFKMATNIKKHLPYFSSYRPLYKGHSCILTFFWSKLQYTFWYMCGYSVISLLVLNKLAPNFRCKFK